MIISKTVRTVSCATAALVASRALAQQTAPTSENLMSPDWQTNSSVPAVKADLNYIYDGPAETTFRGAHVGESAASSLNLGLDSRFNLNDQWFIPVGLQSDNYFLGSLDHVPVPDDIHTLHLRTGLGWRMNDEWTFTGIAGPELYRFTDLQANDIGAFGGFLATYRPSATHIWTFGIFASPNNDVPVLPVVGLRWQINDQYTLEVGMPKTRLTYHIDPKWSLYTGLDLNGTTFRASDNLGTQIGRPQYNNALATYRDIRLGVGVGYDLGHGLRAEVEGGYSVYRRIDYKDIDQRVNFDPAPYVRAGLSYRF
jgi:hypothetical protein